MGTSSVDSTVECRRGWLPPSNLQDWGTGGLLANEPRKWSELFNGLSRTFLWIWLCSERIK